jgi:hypothetical protein
MQTVIASRPMPAKRKLSANQDQVSIKIAKDVVEVARVVAAAENVTLSDLVSDALRPLLVERRRALSEKWSKEGGK